MGKGKVRREKRRGVGKGEKLNRGVAIAMVEEDDNEKGIKRGR